MLRRTPEVKCLEGPGDSLTPPPHLSPGTFGYPTRVSVLAVPDSLLPFSSLLFSTETTREGDPTRGTETREETETNIS